MKLAASAGALFAVVAAAVALGLTTGVDHAALAAFQAASTPATDVLGSILSVAGGSLVTSAVAALLTLIAWRRRGPAALLLLGGFAVAVGIELLCKELLPQPLPPRELSRDLGLLPIGAVHTPYSFPSGHLARTTFLAAVAGRSAPVLGRGLLVALVVAMALTRVALADHWASDVVGGLLLGMAVAAAATAGRRS